MRESFILLTTAANGTVTQPDPKQLMYLLLKPLSSVYRRRPRI